MTSVTQSGNITPGHLVGWVSDNVVNDAGLPLANALSSILPTLAKLTVNFNSTADQPIPIPAHVLAFQLTGIVITNAPTSLTTAVGGFYPVASKGGAPIVAATQVYSALTATNIVFSPTLTTAGATTRFSSANLGAINGILQIWFSLTTAQGASSAADVYLLGVDLT